MKVRYILNMVIKKGKNYIYKIITLIYLICILKDCTINYYKKELKYYRYRYDSVINQFKKDTKKS